MNKHPTHQIDDLAQRVFRDALPPSWVPNEQHKDYGKDYLVEVGENNGDLTGSSFFVQLKGQEKAEFTADQSQVKFSLETKHAAYYVDKIKDLPVFLVLVDVNAKQGWYHFLQPALEANQSWRKQKSVTIYLPAANDLADAQAASGRREFQANDRGDHPESIEDAVAAHKRRCASSTDVFDCELCWSTRSQCSSCARLSRFLGKIEFKRRRRRVKAKISEFLDKGSLVKFKPGEVKITGLPLLADFETMAVPS